MLKDIEWGYTYTTDDGSLAERFYIPALRESVEYSRGTGYFTATSLVHNIRGIEGLIQNNGKMRLLVGCTLDEKEVEAVRLGMNLRTQVEQNLIKIPLQPSDLDTKNGLELLSWMIAKGHMEVRIAVMCNYIGEPVPNHIYHKKMGFVRDKTGNKIAWAGSDNETPSGQSDNSEMLLVSTSWREPERQRHIEDEFEKDWSGQKNRLIIMDVPEAVRQKLLKHAPPNGRIPVRLAKRYIEPESIWSFIHNSHKLENGSMVGLATAPVIPWPHQVQVFRRIYSGGPARLLISDEVGLGKTIQAGLFLRQMWLEGMRKILVLAPAALIHQWQRELREKLNLDWPIYDGKSLVWQKTRVEDRKKPYSWLCGPVIVSSQLARMDGRMRDITSTKWDVVVLDEAHYARQTEPNNPKKHTPNKMLKLMRNLQNQTKHLLLMTATPMQLHPVELYDLLCLLGVPKKWTWINFEKFYNIMTRDLNAADIQFATGMFAASEDMYGEIDISRLAVPKLQSRNAINTLRGDDHIRLHTEDYIIMKKALLLCSPVTRLVSRNTRKHLRKYMRDNNLDWRLGTRNVDDRFVSMSSREHEIYDEVREFILKIYKSYQKSNRGAIGFVLTIYLKRLTSSFASLRATLENHLLQLEGTPHKLYADEYDGDIDSETISKYQDKGIRQLGRGKVCKLLDMVQSLPTDTKLAELTDIIMSLQRDGYQQLMLFTQYTDTMDFLRDHLKKDWKVMCYSGRHGEKPGPGDTWESVSRDAAKSAFLDKSINVLICTDAAAEGLNFQFCGAMINYDMPWNPMRVEQRIGRIDRIGQMHKTIRIVNMYYDGTIEARIYQSLRGRINMFQDVVGTLQPILDLKRVVEDADDEHNTAESNIGPDLDVMLAAETTQYEPPVSPVTMDDIDRVANLIPSEFAGKWQYHIIATTGKKVRITTDRDTFERHTGSMEFWSPGSPSFPEPSSSPVIPKHDTLRQLLDSIMPYFRV